MNKEKEPIQRCLTIIRFFAVKKGTPEYDELKIPLTNELVRLVKQLLEVKSPLVNKLVSDSVVNIMRNFLIDAKTTPRHNSIKFLRFLMDAPNILDLYLAKHIPLFIARCLERDTKEKETSRGNVWNNGNGANNNSVIHEIIQAVKFVRKWIEISPKNFPKLLANALVSFAEGAEDQFKKAAIETLRKLALASPELCAWSGGIRLLIESILEPSISEIADSIIYTLLFLLNEPSYRNIIHPHLDLQKLFSIFTDVDLPIEASKDKSKNGLARFEAQLNLAKKAMITILKSWQGLIFLGNEKTALESLIIALKQPIKPMIRNAIFEILDEILALGARQPVGSGNIFRVQHLLNYFLVMLIQLLLDCGLYKTLLELSGLENIEISGPSQKLLKDLTSLMHNLLPNCQTYANFLVASADQNDPMLVELKAWSSGIINTMGNYIFDNILEKKKKNLSSPFLYQCENLYLSTPLGLPSHRINNETIGKIRFQMEHEADDAKFLYLMRTSNVTVQKEWNRWNWSSILEIIQTFLNNPQRFNEAIKNKFLKKLLSFYQPSKRLFVQLDWKKDHFIHAKTGFLLLKLLLKSRDGRKILSTTAEGFYKVNKSFLSDMGNLLKNDGSTSGDGAATFNPLLNPDNFSQKMIREYVSWIGLFSSTKNGLELLGTFKIFESLREFVDKSGRRDHILIFVLFCLDYGKEGRSREFLQYCLENGSKSLIKAGLDLLRLLYRSELNDFSKWGIDLLVTKLYSEEEISQKALSVIEEITQDPEYMNIFLERWPKLIDLGRNGTNFLITLLSIEQGYDYLTNVNQWTMNELVKWKNEENVEYVDRVEKCLRNALDFVGIEDNTNTFRFPELLNHPESNFVALGIVQRMPWSIYLLYECTEFEGILVMSVTIEYLGQNNQFVLVGRPSTTQMETFQKTTLSANSQFVIKMYVQVGKCFIDNNCREVHDPYYIRCDFNDMKHLSVPITGGSMIEKNGISFIFDSFAEGKKIRLQSVKLALKLGENRSNFSKIPPHIFGELVKTKKGIELLRNNGFLDDFIEDIRNETCPLLKKRASLWAVGHIGRTKRGSQLIAQKGLFVDLVRMAENQECLSLRGTCLYVLNMLANTPDGRAELEKFNWKTHTKNNLGWICLPKDIKQFFSIKGASRDWRLIHWPTQEQYWVKYEEIQKTLHHNEEQVKLLNYFAMLCNKLIQTEAKDEIKKKYKSNPELFMDRFIFYNVMMMMTFYRYKYDIRRFIYICFEKFLNSTNVFLIMDSNTCFKVHIV